MTGCPVILLKLILSLFSLIFTVEPREIFISTIFIKQHSLVDVTAALILCAVVYPLVYRRK